MIQNTAYQKIIENPVKSINSFDLIYINDHELDIKRIKNKDKFIYKKHEKPITDKKILDRIKSLVIPPSWSHVRISSLKNGHIQAVGRDLKFRKQYRYHPKWSKLRNQTKFLKMVDFGLLLPKIRKKINSDLKQQKWTRTKVLALVIKLLEETHIRIGNHFYAKKNSTFGLTTLRRKHLVKDQHHLRFEFVGKRGKKHKVTIKNKKLMRLINNCEEIPGWELFQFYDENGEKQTVDSSMVNEYIHEVSGDNFSAKDFRTWAASVLTFEYLKDCGIAEEKSDREKNVIKAIDFTAKELGNTRSVCKKYYIHPEIIETYLNKKIKPFFILELKKHPMNGLSSSEKFMLELIKNYNPKV